MWTISSTQTSLLPPHQTPTTIFPALESDSSSREVARVKDVEVNFDFSHSLLLL